MRRLGSYVALAGALGLGACAVQAPVGPSFAAMPGNGKSFEQFQADDGRCRQNAAAANNNVSPAQAANQSAVGSAVAGTALGAATGALIGSAGGAVGAGAAIGAGAGLLAGSAIGANNAQASGASLQQNYDITYAQCMAAAGENVPNPTTAPVGYAYGGYPPGYYGAPYGYAYAPPVVFGFGFGGGYGYHRWRHW